MPIKDSLIAATALVHGLVVATRSRTDFKKAGVKIVDPVCCRMTRSIRRARAAAQSDVPLLEFIIRAAGEEGERSHDQPHPRRVIVSAAMFPLSA